MLATMMPATLSRAPPPLPDAFSVTVKQSYDAGGFKMGQFAASLSASKQTFLFDNTTADGTLRQVLNTSEGFASTVWTLYTAANDSLRMYAKFGNDCRPLPLEFSLGQGFDVSWLPRASYTGEVRVGLLKKGDRFFYADARAAFNYSAVFSQDAKNSRLLYVESTWTGKLPGTGNVTQTMRHSFEDDMKVGRPPTSAFDIPVEGCFVKVPPCDMGSVHQLDVYLAHPHQVGPAQQSTAPHTIRPLHTPRPTPHAPCLHPTPYTPHPTPYVLHPR